MEAAMRRVPRRGTILPGIVFRLVLLKIRKNIQWLVGGFVR